MKLSERLRRTRTHRTPDDVAAAYSKEWTKPVNPDGHEAADIIDKQKALLDECERVISCYIAKTPYYHPCEEIADALLIKLRGKQ